MSNDPNHYTVFTEERFSQELKVNRFQAMMEAKHEIEALGPNPVWQFIFQAARDALETRDRMFVVPVEALNAIAWADQHRLQMEAGSELVPTQPNIGNEIMDKLTRLGFQVSIRNQVLMVYCRSPF
jgi:hypothetical protein